MKGKVCLVTGTSAGIGKATAISLAKLDATVLVAMRDSEKSRKALAEIKAKSGKDDAAIIFLPLDLASQESIRKVARTANSKFPRIDVLLNNAGVMEFSRSLTQDSIETTFAVNVIAPFLLTNLLLEKLKARHPRG